MDYQSNKESYDIEKLTDKQVQELSEAFELFDKDGNGYISTSELTTVLRSLGQNPTEQEIMAIINEVDTDCNGTVDFTEFINMMAGKMESINSEEEIAESFRVFYKAPNGEIPVEELRFVLSNLNGVLTAEEIEELLDEADQNSDGFVSYDEFSAMVTPKSYE